MRETWWEKPVCILCGYGWLLFALLFVLSIALWRQQFRPARPIAPVAPAGEPVRVTPVPTLPPPSPVPGSATATPAPAPTDVLPKKPVFSLAFIPLNWSGSRTAFEQAARAQAGEFVSQSGIADYFEVHVILAESPLDNQDLSDSDLLYVLVVHAQENHLVADRFIGLTDGDLSPHGISDVVGWTSGGQSMVAEASDPYVTTHELGHTFGLCDEYSYADWTRQDDEYQGGCPNPYPESCSKDMGVGAICEGIPAEGGLNSMMGPAGLLGAYAFNETCLAHLRETFRNLLQKQEKIQ